MKRQESYVLPVRKSNEFVRSGTAIINSAIRLMDDERTGGYLCISYASRLGEAGKGATIYIPVLVSALGSLYDMEKAHHYLKHSIEKVKRLSLFNKDISGAQSRDEVGDYYAGAVRCDVAPLILAFDGFNEFWNEAVMLVLARKTNVMSEERAQEIVAVHGRECYKRLARKFPKILEPTEGETE